MKIKKTTVGEPDLPRYFPQVFAQVATLRNGRIEFVLPDGRVFRADGPHPGPVGICEIQDADVFARLIREGDLGFCDAYLDGGWSSPDLQALMDVIHADNDDMYDGFTGMALVRAYERLRSGCRAIRKRQARRNILPLRPWQRVLRAMARRHDDLFLGPVRDRAGEIEAAQRPNTPPWSTRWACGRAITCWKSAAAGAGSPNTPRSERG